MKIMFVLPLFDLFMVSTVFSSADELVFTEGLGDEFTAGQNITGGAPPDLHHQSMLISSNLIEIEMHDTI